MKQWDVYQWNFPHGSHPAVILSPTPVCVRSDRINVLGCSSHRARREPYDHEILLDQADGLDWETLCRLDAIWTAAKSELVQHRGTVTFERRRLLGRKFIQLYGLVL